MGGERVGNHFSREGGGKRDGTREGKGAANEGMSWRSREVSKAVRWYTEVKVMMVVKKERVVGRVSQKGGLEEQVLVGGVVTRG